MNDMNGNHHPSNNISIMDFNDRSKIQTHSQDQTQIHTQNQSQDQSQNQTPLPYSCKTCGKKIASLRNLRLHEEIAHSLVRKFSCPIIGCLKAFKYKCGRKGRESNKSGATSLQADGVKTYSLA